jgi:glycosyltransferase involved in cell wall biosynthesis
MAPRWLADAIGLVRPVRMIAARLHEGAGRVSDAARLAQGSRTRYAARLRELAAALDTGELPLAAPPRTLAPLFNGRVVMALYGAPPWFANGYSVRSLCLLRALSAAGVSCLPVTRPNFPQDTAPGRGAPPATEDEIDGIRYRRLWSAADMMRDPPTDYIEAFAEGLAAAVRESGASVVHAASNHLVGLAGCLAAEWTGARSVYEIRGLWHRSTATRRSGWERTERFALHEALERQAALRADHVVVLSRFLAEHVRNWGVAEARIIIVPNGVDAEAFRPLPRDPALRVRLGVGPGAFLVGFAGALTRYEGLDTLLEAVALLRCRGIDAAAVLIGEGEEEARLRRLARRRGVPAVFTGRVPFASVPAYLNACDALPFPRRRSGVTMMVPPLKLAEAMACGVPVVVADLPPLLEYVEDRRTGLVVGDGVKALADALACIHADPAAAGMAAAARSWVVRERSWDKVIKPLLAAYRRPAPSFEPG